MTAPARWRGGGCPGWEDAGRACESRAAQGGHAGRARKVEMSKKREFGGYFCSRRNQESGSGGRGDTSVACWMGKVCFSKLGGRGPQNQQLSRAPWQSSGSQGCPQAGVRDPVPFPASPSNGRAQTEASRRLQGSAFCIRGLTETGRFCPKPRSRSIAKHAWSPFAPGAALCSPREREGTGSALGGRAPW